MTMNPSARPNDILLIAGKVITIIMQAALGLAAVALAIATPALLIFRNKVITEFAEKMEDPAVAFPLLQLAGVMLLALVMVAMLFVFFGKLRAIIDTVGEGDPFAPANADRLARMGWLMLAVQVLLFPFAWLGMALASYASELEDVNLTVSASMDLEGILLIIILFILARVFRHGADMREDLEGTV